jgi:hypothetical protein
MSHHPVVVDLTDPYAPVNFGEPFQPALTTLSEGFFINDRILYELQEGHGVRMFDLYLY